LIRAAALLVALFGTAAATPQYAGSPACMGCHAREHAAWSGSRHQLAMRSASVEPGRFDGPSQTFASLTFRPHGTGTRALFSVGSTPPTQSVPLAFILGVSEVEQYLTPVGRGRLQVLPAGWDPERAEWFDVFPEAPARDDWAHWTNPGATANSQCLECHTTRYEKGYDAVRDCYDSTWVERGVGCEACHGPGAAHVEHRRQGRASDSYGHVAGTTPLPGCVFCHSRRAMLADPYDPGLPADEQMDLELLDSGLYHPDGQLRGEAYEWVSFQMSRMAAEGVGCHDCHEPHAGTLRTSGNALCMRCHEPQLDTPQHTHHAAGSTGGVCVECHMPEVTFMERDPRRDHLLGRPDPELAAAIGAPDACTTCHTDRSQQWAAEVVGRWYPSSPQRDTLRQVAATFAAARDGHPEAAPFLASILADPAIDPVRRASAARLLARFPDAPGVREALRRALGDALTLVRAASVRGLAAADVPSDEVRADLVRLADDPARAVRLEAAFALRSIDVGSLPAARRSAVERAFVEWLAAQEVLAELPETNYNRGLFLAARGDAAGAEAAYRAAIARWPHDLPPRHNLALLLAEAGRRDEAVRELDAILARSPGWPPTAFARALLHADGEEWSEAATLLEACLAGDPNHPRAAYNLGLARAKLGDAARAEEALERATRDPASRRDALRELVRLAHLRGDEAAQARWLPEALLADPGVRDDPRVRAALGVADGGEPGAETE